MPRITVIVPLYNKAAFIDRCLDSILAQTLTDFEAIVVDDGSTDGSPDAVRRRKDPRLRLISQPNAGPGAARNTAAKLASSPLLAFLDGDDTWEPDYLRLSVDRFDREPLEVAALAWALTLLPGGRSTAPSWKKRGIPEGVYRAQPDSSAATIIAILAEITPSATVIRKEAFDRMGGYYARNRCLYSEDAWLYLKILLNMSVAFDHRPLARRDESGAELSANLSGVRPIEPFLTDPDGLRESCPREMRKLLDEVLARRALKTAAVYGYWGESGKARELVKRFVSAGDWQLPWFAAAMAGCTPAGGLIGRLARTAASTKANRRRRP